MRPFTFIGSNLHGSPAMRRAALCSLGGVLFMGLGGLVAFVTFVVAILRTVFVGFSAGGRTLLMALAIGLLAQLAGTALLRLGAFAMRGAAPESDARRGGVTIEGEVVERDEPGRPRLGGRSANGE